MKTFAIENSEATNRYLPFQGLRQPVDRDIL